MQMHFACIMHVEKEAECRKHVQMQKEERRDGQEQKLLAMLESSRFGYFVFI